VLEPARLGTLRRLTPLSSCNGYDRGLPVDRHYVESFLRRHAPAITGAVLEVRDLRYTNAFGRATTRRDVIDVDRSNPRATIVADLCRMDDVPSGTFDCAIITQTLQYVSDPARALAELARVLAPGGTLLATVPTAPPLDLAAGSADRWRFTPRQLEELLDVSFGGGSVHAMGNPLSLVASVMGLAAGELSARELAHADSRFPVVLGLHATAPGPHGARERR
jgi:SAM-dependent methyltransferase